jgi:hypothetical protein
MCKYANVPTRKYRNIPICKFANRVIRETYQFETCTFTNLKLATLVARALGFEPRSRVLETRMLAVAPCPYIPIP